MSEYRFPVPGSYLRKIVDGKARRGEAFSFEDAVVDYMLAEDRGMLKPHRYLAKRWGWTASKTFRALKEVRNTAQNWRNLASAKSEANAKQTWSKGEANFGDFSTKNGVERSKSEARVKQERSSIDQTTNYKLKRKNLNNPKTSAKSEQKRARAKKFFPPECQEVFEYMKKFSGERNIRLNAQVEAEKFFDHFSSNGWKVGGKAPMKDWKASARNWIRNSGTFEPKNGRAGSSKPASTTKMTTDDDFLKSLGIVK